MKCTGVYSMMSALRDTAILELKRALEKHNGEYRWDDNVFNPVVDLCSSDGMFNMVVERVFDSNGMIKVEGHDEYGDYLLAYLGDLSPSDILYIVGGIAGDDDVSMNGVQEVIDDCVRKLQKILKDER